MVHALDDPMTAVVGRDVACSFSTSKAGTYEDIDGVVDYELTELSDAAVTHVVNRKGALAVADLPEAGGVNLVINNAERHLPYWDTLIHRQGAGNPLWFKLSEVNDREPVLEGETTFTVAIPASDASAAFAGTSKKDIQKYASKGMVIEVGAGPSRHVIKSITSAIAMEVDPAQGQTALAATGTWKIRHPSMERNFEAYVIGHSLVQSRGGVLNGRLRLQGVTQIAKPYLVASA